MKKEELRKEFKAKRKALSMSESSRLDDLILIQFQSQAIPFLQTLLSYWPIEENNEPSTHLITEFLRFRNPELTIAYPVTDFERGEMVAVATDVDTAFTKKTLNLFEPNEGMPVDPGLIDLVIVPLVAVDERGYRVGYGKGFYDKYLALCREDCLRVGLSYFEPVPAIDDCNEFDVPLNLCITPQSVYVF